MWATPFSGPSQRIGLSAPSRRENAPGSASASSTASPTTSGANARTASTWTSVPRPMVKTRL